jgi:hypothetical protein
MPSEPIMHAKSVRYPPQPEPFYLETIDSVSFLQNQSRPGDNSNELQMMREGDWLRALGCRARLGMEIECNDVESQS